MRYLANAFSLNMLAVSNGSLRFTEVSTEHASNYLKPPLEEFARDNHIWYKILFTKK